MNNSLLLDGSTVFEPGRVKISSLPKAHQTPYFFHKQKFWEFIYVNSGFALLGGTGESVLLSSGDFSVVAPGETHSLVSPERSEIFCLLFSENELGSLKDEFFSMPGFIELSLRAKSTDTPKNFRFEAFRLDFSERMNFVRLCDRITDEKANKCKGWQQMVKSLLCETLVFYSRLDIASKRASKNEDSSQSAYYSVIKYLEDNYRGNITGTDLAKITGLSAEYLLKQFKNELELSPADYLRRFRVAKSMELLCGTELSVNEIAESCGFVDFSAYSRVFKNLTGETPSAFRKKFRI